MKKRIIAVILLAIAIWLFIAQTVYANDNCPRFVTAFAKTITVYSTLDGQIGGNAIAASGNRATLEIKDMNRLSTKWYVDKQIQRWDKMVIYFTIQSNGFSYNCQYRRTMR